MKNWENGVVSFDKAITRWDEAVPIGNGIVGCLLWGDGAPLRMSLDRSDLWDCRPAPRSLEDDFKFDTLVRLVREGKRPEYCKMFMDCWLHPTPTKIPAGCLELDFGEKAGKVESRLSIFKAEAIVRLCYRENEALVYSFLHADKKLGYIKVLGRIPEVRLQTHDFTPWDKEEKMPDESIRQLGYPPVECFDCDGVRVVLQETCTDFSFAIVMGMKHLPDGMEIVYHVICSSQGANWLEDGIALVKEGLRNGYDGEKETHTAWWDAYWSRSRLSLPDKYLENGWYLANYMLACCSGKGCPPMALQGVWSADEGLLPPWKGEYAANVNLQFCYRHYLAANHWEEGKVVLDHLWNMRHAAAKCAREFYDAEGYFMPTSSSLDGQTVGGYPQCYSLGNQIWQALMFYDYYLYSGDEEFLRGRAYPYLKGTAAVMERWLEPQGEKLVFAISASPEYRESQHQAWLKSMSTYDITLCRCLYSVLSTMAETIEPQECEHWQEMLQRLPQIPTQSGQGVLIAEEEPLAFSHRHHSHLIGMYPLDMIRYHGSEQEKIWMEESIHKLEEMGTGLWVGFSFTWLAAFYARMGNGEGAAHQLHLFYKYLCSPNGFHLNGDFKRAGITSLHYRPFTLEANLQAADAVQEMLLQCHEEDIRLFPAIPGDWEGETISFQNLCVHGGVTVSAEWKDKVLFVEFCASRKKDLLLINPFQGHVCVKRDGCEDQILKCQEGERLEINMESGEKVYLCSVD